MIWLVLFLVLAIGNVLTFLFIPSGNLKETSLIVISLLIGALGFSFKDSIANFQIKKKVKKRYKEVCERFNKYFEKSVHLDSKPPKELEEDKSESELLSLALEHNIEKIDGAMLNSVKLCYFCLKWKETKAPEEYEVIKRTADSIGIRYNQLTESVKKFLATYNTLVVKKTSFEQLEESIDYEELLKSFAKEYYKDLQFFEIKEKFYQNKNLHETLIEIIKEGKLSTYGITQETVKKLQKTINAKSKRSNVFAIFVNLTAEDKENFKDYLKKYGSINAVGISQRTEHKMRFGLYIVKTDEWGTSSGILADIKRNAKITSESIIRVTSLNYADGVTHTLPLNQSFTNENLKKCYETLEWFKVDFNYSDSLLWSEITSSNITPNELLSVVPFNIFCKGILPCEREYIVKNYEQIKNDLGVETLTGWKDKDANLVASTILTHGAPSYSKDESTSILKVTNESEKEKKVKKRILSIARQIVKGANEFDKSLKPQDISSE